MRCWCCGVQRLVKRSECFTSILPTLGEIGNARALKTPQEFVRGLLYRETPARQRLRETSELGLTELLDQVIDLGTHAE